jgi:hypothetical protein
MDGNTVLLLILFIPILAFGLLCLVVFLWEARKRKSKAVGSTSTAPVSDDRVLGLAVDRLVALYDGSPRGEGFVRGSTQAAPVRKVGSELNDLGGFKLMRQAHQLFAEKRPQAARNLEMVWDGIGGWGG